MASINVETPMTEAERQFYSDIVIGVAEHPYSWFEVAQYQYVMDGRLHVVAGPMDEAHGTYCKLNHVDFYDGLRRFYIAKELPFGPLEARNAVYALIGGHIKIGNSDRNALLRAQMEEDGGVLDRDLCDCVAQAAVLGDVMYG